MGKKQRTAKMSNELVRGQWNLTSVIDGRVLVLLAARAQEGQNIYTIKAKELLPAERPQGSAYKLVWSECNRLIGKSVTIKTDTGFQMRAVFIGLDYDQKAGTITVALTPFALEHLVLLKKHYTLLDVTEFVQLSGIYSQRLYMLLRSWQSVPEITIPLSDMRKKLNVPASIARYADFRRYVLERAAKEINEKTSLTYSWEPIKRGRSVYAIRFIFAAPRREQTVRKKHEASKRNNELVLAAYKCSRSGGCKEASPKNKKLCKLCEQLKLKPSQPKPNSPS